MTSWKDRISLSSTCSSWRITIDIVRNTRFLNSPKVRLIDENGTNLGEVDSGVALKRARETGLDLILVNKATNPPVCKIANFGKLKYEAKKKSKENKQKVQELKTIKLRPNIHKHDLDIDVAQAKKFLLKGDKVKLECRFRRRELSHPEIGRQKIDYIISQLNDVGKVEKNCELVMTSIVAILAPV